jgi:hypothetical protein
MRDARQDVTGTARPHVLLDIEVASSLPRPRMEWLAAHESCNSRRRLRDLVEAPPTLREVFLAGFALRSPSARGQDRPESVGYESSAKE